MFLPTKAHLKNLKNHEEEPTLRIGRKVPKNAVNLAYYFNPTATDGEQVLCADAPRSTIDHRFEEKYLYKYNCPDNDNSTYKYFDQFYFFEDDEGYSGYLPLVNVTWYEKNHVLQKSAVITKTFITDNKNDIDTNIFYMENEDGQVVEDADPSSDTNGVYAGNLFLDTATYEIKDTNTEIINKTQYINILDAELIPQNLNIGYTNNIINNTDINTMMKNPITDSSSPWPKEIWVLENGIYNNANGSGTPLISGNPYNGYTTAANNPLQFSYVEKDPLSWNESGGEEGDTEYQEEYGRIFLDYKVTGSGALTATNPFPAENTTYSTESELNIFYSLMTNSNYTTDDIHSVISGTGDGNLNDSQTMFVQIMNRFHNGQESADNITVQCIEVSSMATGSDVPENNAVVGWIASFRMIYIHRAHDVDGTHPWAVYANYAGQLQKTMEEIKITPASWEATVIYSGIVRKVWNTYDGMAYYRGSVTQGEGAGNVNPELNSDILLFPDDEGWLRRKIYSIENDEDGNFITVTKNIYEIEAEHFYITDVFKNNIACFYKYDLKYPINDYRGPDKYGFYSGDAVKVYTTNMKPLLDGYEYQLKLEAVDTETETYIVDNSIRTKEIATKYNASLYTSFISKTTDAYKASYNAFIDYDTDEIINTNNGIDEEIYNKPFMFKNIDFITESVDKYERSSKIKILNPKIIEDTRAWISFEYKVIAYRKSKDGLGTEEKFESTSINAKILNKEYAVESEYSKFDNRAMIISPIGSGGYLTPLDIILADETFMSENPLVTIDNSDEFIFYCELITENLNELYFGAINIKCNADGSGYITAETTLDTGFFNEQLGTYTDKLIINNPYLVENNKIYAGYMIKCLDVRQIGVHPSREKGLLDSWYPMLKFGHYSQVMDQYGAHTKICYTMPEYDEQNYSTVYGIPYIDIEKDKAEILNTHMIKVNKYPLAVINNNISVYRKKDDELFKLTIKNVSFSEGIIITEEALSENDYILVDYTYLEEYYQYRGYLRNEADFARIDLNPNQYHTYSDLTYEPSELKPTTNLYNKIIYFYLRPTIRFRGEDVENITDSGTHIEWDTEHPMVYNEKTLYHTIDRYWPESELDIYIGSVYIRQNTSLYSTILIDTRTRGGGVLEEMKDSLRRELEPESDFYLDIGCYDGRPYQENAVIIVRLDNSILEDYGGRFKQGDIEQKVKKFLGLGVYPIIEYVDSYSKHELPQYNLDIQDEYTNMLDQTLDFSLECVSI